MRAAQGQEPRIHRCRRQCRSSRWRGGKQALIVPHQFGHRVQPRATTIQRLGMGRPCWETIAPDALGLHALPYLSSDHRLWARGWDGSQPAWVGVVWPSTFPQRLPQQSRSSAALIQKRDGIPVGAGVMAQIQIPVCCRHSRSRVVRHGWTTRLCPNRLGQQSASAERPARIHKR